jgi:hypothetical protein
MTASRMCDEDHLFFQCLAVLVFFSASIVSQPESERLRLTKKNALFNLQLITHWQELGVAAADIKKLRDGGINTVEALAHAPKKELLIIKGISEAKVEKIQKEGPDFPTMLTPPSCCTELTTISVRATTDHGDLGLQASE